MTNLPVKPGIDGLPTNTIPTDPVAFIDWFKNSFLPRWAANADARNAVPTSASVVITGNTGTPAGIGIGPNSVTNGELVMRSPLSVMGNPTGVEGNVQDIVAPVDGDSLQRVAGALVWAPVSATVNVADSITGIGTPASPLELVGDNNAPGASQYYGTDATSTKGFHPVQGSVITTLTQSGGASQSYAGQPNATTYEVIVIGGGGGGGSGAAEATGNLSGGGGGGGGAISYGVFRASDLTFPITVAFSNTSGGAGGVAKVASGVGNPGTAGATVQFGNLLQANGGGGGGAGVATGSTGGVVSTIGNWVVGTVGGTGTAANNGNPGGAPLVTGSNTPCMGGGGGGGAGVSAFTGGQGGSSTYAGGKVSNLAGGAGGAPGATGLPGAAGSGLTGSAGAGGGGGATSGTAGTGGAGTSFGAGGGGGGALFNTVGTSGAGGLGGPAACIIVAY